MMVVWPWGLIYNLKCIVLQLLIWVCLKIGVAYFGPQNNIEIVEFRRKPVLFRTPQYCPQPMGAQKGFSIYVLSAVQRPPALLRSVEQFLQANCEWLDSRFQLVLLCDLWGLCSTIAGVAHWKVWASDCFFFLIKLSWHWDTGFLHKYTRHASCVGCQHICRFTSHIVGLGGHDVRSHEGVKGKFASEIGDWELQVWVRCFLICHVWVMHIKKDEQHRDFFPFRLRTNVGAEANAVRIPSCLLVWEASLQTIADEILVYVWDWDVKKKYTAGLFFLRPCLLLTYALGVYALTWLDHVLGCRISFGHPTFDRTERDTALLGTIQSSELKEMFEHLSHSRTLLSQC